MRALFLVLLASGCSLLTSGASASQDAHILNVLSNGFAVAIDGNRLTLTAGDNGLGYRAQS